eukprot:3867694-Prymnesium_polylepis.1
MRRAHGSGPAVAGREGREGRVGVCLGRVHMWHVDTDRYSMATLGSRACHPHPPRPPWPCRLY